MAKKTKVRRVAGARGEVDGTVAAVLAGIIYQARLKNRESKLNIPEEEVVSDVLDLWRRVRDSLAAAPK